MGYREIDKFDPFYYGLNVAELPPSEPNLVPFDTPFGKARAYDYELRAMKAKEQFIAAHGKSLTWLCPCGSERDFKECHGRVDD